MYKSKIFSFLDSLIFTFLCFSVFCLPFSKAGIESFVWPSIFIFILKRILGYKSDCFFRLLPATKLNNALGILVVSGILSVVFSCNPDLSLRGFLGKELKFIFIYFMLIESLNNDRKIKILLTIIILSAILISMDAGIQYFRGVDLLRGYGLARLTASFPSANAFGAWLIIVIPLFLGLLISGRIQAKVCKIALSILIILLFLCLLATYARGAWLGFVVSIVFMYLFIFKSLTSRAKKLYIYVCAGLLVGLIVLPSSVKGKIGIIGRFDFKFGQTVGERIKTTINIKDGSNLIRLNLWHEALDIIEDFPVFGSGLNTYSVVARSYKITEGGGVYPHNSFIQKTAETGLFGLGVFLWVLYVFFKINLQYLNRKKDYLVLGLLSGILAFLIHAFFDTHLYSLQLVVLFWYMLGLTVAVIKLGSNFHQGLNR